MDKLHKNDYVYHPLEMIKIINNTIIYLQENKFARSGNELRTGICTALQMTAQELYPNKSYFCSNLHNLLLEMNPYKSTNKQGPFHPYWYSRKVDNGGITKRVSLLIDLKVEILHSYTEGAE